MTSEVHPQIMGTATTEEGSPRVLVVEDSSFFRKLVKDALANAGFRVTATSSAEQALEELRSTPVSLLVTALVMPGMDGLALLRRVREEWSPKRLRVMVLTEGVVATEHLAELDQLGCRSFVNKFAPPDHFVFRANAVLFPDENDARQNLRIAVSVPVQVRLGPSSTAAYSYNLSRDGMYIRSHEAPAPGTIVEVAFALPDRSRYVRVTAEVMHAQRRQTGARIPPGFGVRFRDVDETDAQAITEFVKRTIEVER